MREMAKETANKFFGQMWDDLIGYFKIYDFIKLKSKTVLGSSQPLRSVDAFWYSILGDKFTHKRPKQFVPLKDGDVIKLKGVFMSEWAPKLPGRIWTREGVEDFLEGQQHVDRHIRFGDGVYAVLEPYGKQKVVSAGFGSVRIKRRVTDPNNFMYMSLVDEANWQIDYGIPVVVSKSVYNAFQKYSLKNGAPWLKSVEGVLHIDEDLPFKELVPKAIGATISEETEASLRYRPSLRKCYLRITSPLSVKFTYNDSHPKATAWTMFETSLKREPYRYTYTSFNPQNTESTEKAVKFIKWYAEEYGGKKIITDFDGMVPRLDAAIPLKVNPMKSRKSDIKKVVTKCDNWVKSTLLRIQNEY